MSQRGVCTTRVCSASNSLLCLWTTRKTKLGKDAHLRAQNNAAPLPSSYTKGISSLAGGGRCRRFCHRLHTWHSQASYLQAIDAAWRPTDRKKGWSEGSLRMPASRCRRWDSILRVLRVFHSSDPHLWTSEQA